jgi:putative sterol carrier protein
MPDAGRAATENYLLEIPSSLPEYPALPWRCAGATMLNVYFEVRKDALLDHLPPQFNRSVPSFCRLLIIDHPQSPIGPFREATLALGCRYNMFPAGFATASLTNNPQALAAGLLERGFPNTLGTIEFEVSGDQVRAALADSSGPLLSVVLPDLQTIEPGRLAYDHVNAFRTTGHNGSVQAELVVLAPDVDIDQAAISKGAQIIYPGARDTVWHFLRSRRLISAQLVRGTRTFAAAKKPSATQPGQPTAASQGGAITEITNLEQVFTGLPLVFNKEAAKGLTAVYQFDLTGEKAAQYHVIIENETCTVKEGKHASPHITITMAGQDYLDMVNGKLNPQMAFMSGKLKMAGDMGLAMRMQSLFPR